jgi:hypothetical protein
VHMAELINAEVGKEATGLKREEQRQLKKGLSALAVVAGARPALNADGGGQPDFRLGVLVGRGRASVGPLRVGGDILQIVAGYLSWGVELQRTWMTHEGKKSVNDCHFPPDGKFILTCSADRTLRLWCAVSGELLKTFKGHSNCVRACCFTPDGNSVLGASDDLTLKLWDLTSGALEKTLVGHQHPVTGCDFAPGGATVLSGPCVLRWHPETADHLHERPSAHRDCGNLGGHFLLCFCVFAQQWHAPPGCMPRLYL